MGKNNQSDWFYNPYQSVTNQILQLLETQKLTWNKPWISLTSDSKRPHNAGSGRYYSGLNQILLSMCQLKANYPYSGWLTYKQVHELGGRVIGGMKSTSVYHFQMNYIDKDGKKYEKDVVQQMSIEEQNLCGLKKHSLLLYYNVFNIAQTSDLPVSYYQLKEQPLLTEVEKDDKAEDLIAKTKARIIHIVSNEACYNYLNDVIFLPERKQFNGQVAYYETVLHELGHWTGHKSRLNRSIKNIFGSDEYAKEELIAELCSAFLCADLGFSMGITNNAAYIQDWIRVLKNDSRYFFQVIRSAEVAAKYIHSCARTTEAEVIKDESSNE